MNIRIDADLINNYDLDDIPKYIFQRDILGYSKLDKSIKENILSSKMVTKITDQQFDDGSWDLFHTLSLHSKTSLTTENAIRRLLILGLDINDEPIKKVYKYMERFLKKEVDIRDRKEGLSDWITITDLFAAAWMLEIDKKCRIAGKIANRWALLITESFKGDLFNFDNYYKAFLNIFHCKPGKRAWDIECFHIAAILQNRLEADIEERFIDYILKNNKGLYYISRGKLTDLPKDFMSREASRFLNSHFILSRYESYKTRCDYVVEWLMENRGVDGLWDFGPKVKDNTFFPFSHSWREVSNRKIDSTLFVQKYLTNLLS